MPRRSSAPSAQSCRPMSNSSVETARRPARPAATTLARSKREVGDVAAVLRSSRDAIGPTTIAKFLFTSGSTGVPKARDQHPRHADRQRRADHRSFCFLPRRAAGHRRLGAVEPHRRRQSQLQSDPRTTAARFYIDDGKPTPSGIGATRAHAARDFTDLVLQRAEGLCRAAARTCTADAALRESFFRRSEHDVVRGRRHGAARLGRARRTVGRRRRASASSS